MMARRHLVPKEKPRATARLPRDYLIFWRHRRQALHSCFFADRQDCFTNGAGRYFEQASRRNGPSFERSWTSRARTRRV